MGSTRQKGHPTMSEWFGRQAERIRRIAAYVMAGKTDELLYSLNNRWRKIDLEHVSVDVLGLSPDRSHFHSSSGGPDCARILRSLRIPSGSVGLDLGSGKGGAAMTMARFPFTEVIGVELSEALVRMARTNVQRARLRNVRFVQGDAGMFTDLDRVTHIYNVQPFSLRRDGGGDRELAFVTRSLRPGGHPHLQEPSLPRGHRRRAQDLRQDQRNVRRRALVVCL